MDNCFTRFKASIDAYTLPERFTFPFYYEPHPLSVLAAEELQDHIENQTDWEYNFGTDAPDNGFRIGKMFGVLVVQNQAGELGYLSAFSGKLAESNHHPKFVPPVFDTLTKDSLLNVGMRELNPMHEQIRQLEQAPDFIACQKHVAEEKALGEATLLSEKQALNRARKVRKLRRKQGKLMLSAEDYQILEATLAKESQHRKIRFSHLRADWEARLAKNQAALDKYIAEIEAIKLARKNKSSNLQQRIFEQYQFLNANGEIKDLIEIFKDKAPIAGSGECAAPKLLQYAFQHQMKPIALAEFWWGKSPKSSVRKHKHFYPACTSKCKPILGHMLEGLKVDDNPMLVNPAFGQHLKTVYEDDALVVLNKPSGFLSVPGKNIQDSVLFRMKIKYPNATGPLIVHRLDMSTSGLMLIAKSKEVHKYLQYQFIKRRVKKRYVAVLDGILSEDEGEVILPLRVDLDDRPRQVVCYEYGKPAKTEWKVIDRTDGKTRVHFFPITGRTHQLRMHAAHSLGLNMPIIGDDLYGTKSNRLHLHAAFIEFRHPVSKELMAFEVEAEF